jgi:hypothetical protein
MANKRRSEDSLRKQILKILDDKSMKVIDNCSPVEFGADILFMERNYFNKEELCAIQIKVGNLTSSNKRPSKKIIELLGQALIGIAKERVIGSAKYKVSKFYIVIDGQLNPFARQIMDEINYHFKQILIIEKDDLDKFLTETKPKLKVYENR